MKKLLFKTFLVAIVACACFTLASCSKSADDLNNEVKEMVKDGKIEKENIDDAIDLLGQIVDKAIELAEENKNVEDISDIDADAVKDAVTLAQAANTLGNALEKTELSKDQEEALQDLCNKFEEID